MTDQDLATYLNDHLAGSVVGLALLDHIGREDGGTPLGAFAAAFRAEVADDRRELEELIARLGIAQSRPRQAAAWITEKLTELKLRVDDPRVGALHRLESLEALSLGIEGKRLMWRSLIAATAGRPDLAGTDYEGLERRAADQRERVESLRLEAGRAAFAGPGGQES